MNSLYATCSYAEELSVKELPVGNLLTWATSSEEDNELFILQKSSDGETFTTVSIVRGSGTSEEELKYLYLDLSIGEERVFYRLMDIDKNDDFSYSKIVVLQRHFQNNLLITNLENTTEQESFRFNIESAIQTKIDLQIFTETNVGILSKQITLIKGANAVSIDASEFIPGTYRLLVKTNDESEEAFFIKDSVDKESLRPVALQPKTNKN